MKNNVSKSNNKLDNPRSISTTYVRPVVGSDNGFNASDIKKTFPTEKKSKLKPVLIGCIALGAAASLSAVIAIPLVVSNQSFDQGVNQDNEQGNTSNPGGSGSDSVHETPAEIMKQIEETYQKLTNLRTTVSTFADEVTKDNLKQYITAWFDVDPSNGVKVEIQTVNLNATLNTSIDVVVTLSKRGISAQKVLTYGGFAASQSFFNEAWTKLQTAIYFKESNARQLTVTQAIQERGSFDADYYVNKYIHGFDGTLGAYAEGVMIKLVGFNYADKRGSTNGLFTFRMYSGSKSVERSLVCNSFKPDGIEYLGTKSNWSNITPKQGTLGQYYYKDFYKARWDNPSGYSYWDQDATEAAFRSLLTNLPETDSTFQMVISVGHLDPNKDVNFDYHVTSLDFLVGFRYAGQWSHLNTQGEHRSEAYVRFII